jgi:hypothetical protein
MKRTFGLGSATQVMLASMHKFRKGLNKKIFCAASSYDSITCLALPSADFRMVTGASLLVIPRGGIHNLRSPRTAQTHFS